jgi:hypothetical protein
VYKKLKENNQSDHSIDELSISNKESRSELRLKGVDCEEVEAKGDEEHNVDAVSDIEFVKDDVAC